MFKTFLVVLVTAIALASFLTPTAKAQAPCQTWGTGFVNPAPYYTFGCDHSNNLPGEGYSFGCWVRLKCAPLGAAHEFCLQCALAAGSPISLTTGNTFIEETDARIPGLSNGLSLVRTWNSMWPTTQMASQVGLFGPNWRSTFEERVFASGDGYMKYARGDGNFWSFYYVGSAWAVVAPENATASLVQGTSYWTLTFQNGEKRTFDINSGLLTNIVDRNGNTTQVSYDFIGRLVAVTDPASRHLYFGYQDSSSRLVTSVTSDIGITLSYAYDTQGRLTQVTKPDSTTISFQYNSQSLVSAVLDSNGVVLESHTYDSYGRGLTSSRAGGVDSVTVTYPNQ